MIAVLFITDQTATEYAFEIGLLDTVSVFILGMIPFILLVWEADRKKKGHIADTCG